MDENVVTMSKKSKSKALNGKNLFIGDSRTVGLMEYGKIKNAEFFADTGMSVYNIYKKRITVPKVGRVSLEKLLSKKKYDRIYVMMGINEGGYDFNKTVGKYKSMIKFIMKKQPKAKIIIQANLHVTKKRSNSDKHINNKRINKFNKAIKKIADATGYSSDIPLSLIISQPGVLNTNQNYDVEKYGQMISPVLKEALDKFCADRKREGENLKKDLLSKLSKLEECAAFFKEWQPKMESNFKEQITAKFKELLADQVDENRIMTETAAMLVKYTINEEIVRLHSHLAAMKTEIENNPAPGKKLDFLCQEANREINTIGSKNQFGEVGAMVIASKDSLENIREQAKNVE